MLLNKSDFVLVERKVEGPILKNGLFYFIKKQEEKGVLEGKYPCNQMLSENGASYLLISLDEKLPCFFPDFEIKEHHLRVDEFYPRNASNHGFVFTPSHYTIRIKHIKTQEISIIRVYFDKNGKAIRTTVKQQDNPLVSSEEPSNEITAFAKEQVIPAQSLLLALLKEKIIYSTSLYQHSFELEQTLQESTELLEWKLQASKLLKIIEEKNLYNDNFEDPRILRLQARIEAKEQMLPMTASAAEVSLNEPSVIKEKPSKKVKSQKKKKGKSAAKPALLNLRTSQSLEALQRTIEDKVSQLNSALGKTAGRTLEENIAAFNGLNLEAQNCFYDIHELVSLMELSLSSKEFSPYLKAKINTLPFHRALFEESIIGGELDLARLMAPIFIDHTNMLPLYFNLLESISDSTDPILCLRQIAVAQYFYETSAAYRTALENKSLMFKVTPDASICIGFLTSLYCNNNLPAFKMALEQGVSPHSIQSALNGEGMSALKSLIIHYKRNSDSAQRDLFFNLLFEHGATLNSINRPLKIDFEQQSQLPSHLKAEGISPGNIAHNLKRLSKDKTFSFSAGITNALEVALNIKGDLSVSLLEILARHADLYTLLMEMTKILDSNAFRTITLTKSIELPLAVCRTSSDKETILNRSIYINFLNDVYYPPRFVFYLHEDCPFDNSIHFEMVQVLLGSFEEKLVHINDEKKSLLMKFCSNEGMQLEKKGSKNNEVWISYYYRASQILYSQILSPSINDNERFIQLSCLRAKLLKASIYGAERANFQFAEAYLDSLPTQRKEILNARPLCKWLLTKLAKLDNNTFFQSPEVQTRGSFIAKSLVDKVRTAPNK